jgi:UDP-glucose 4-epimerase
VLGYDPRLQLCHETDALEVLHRACLEEHPGIFNVAGPGIVYLSQAIRLAGRPAVAVPLPLVRAAASLVRRGGAGDLTGDQLQFLLYGRAADIGRLRTGFGYEPRYSTKAALVDFVADRRTADPVQRAVAWREPRELCAQLTRARSLSARSRRSPG